MARISKDEHSRILQMVDGEHRKVAEVAAEYGCTPANIYVLLRKLRPSAASSVEAVSADTDLASNPGSPVLQDSASLSTKTAVTMSAVPDLFELDAGTDEHLLLEAKTGGGRGRVANQVASVAESEALVGAPRPGKTALPQQEPKTVASGSTRPVVTEPPRLKPGKKGGGFDATLAKPGVGLIMRTSEGEENLTPFRSLDDLLSAIKPILRAAARSPDAVWFSIQPVDLALLDSDAA